MDSSFMVNPEPLLATEEATVFMHKGKIQLTVSTTKGKVQLGEPLSVTVKLNNTTSIKIKNVTVSLKADMTVGDEKKHTRKTTVTETSKVLDGWAGHDEQQMQAELVIAGPSKNGNPTWTATPETPWFSTLWFLCCDVALDSIVGHGPHLKLPVVVTDKPAPVRLETETDYRFY
eukprot:TRINITY_DN67974_c5_g1_i1.p1 TRINITY_DN67974_c5_g1~~TRINITY_DN67974_c5_g1_i1.p1  ORF type:complete len:174 (+),score=31.29 TRINITY_DN67974_c5_g1_i1:197-718(+)